MAPYKRTPEKDVAFLAALAETCSVAHACKAVAISRTQAYKWRREDPEFAAAWDEAKAIGAGVLEDEAVRRAQEGLDEPVFHQGKVISTVRKYSDTLLIFLLKGMKRDVYGERIQQEISGPNGGPIEMDETKAASRLASLLATAKLRKEGGEGGDDLI